MRLEYNFNGSLNWYRGKNNPIENFQCYKNESYSGMPNAPKCVDTHYKNDSNDIDPCELLMYSVASSHMYAFIELCSNKGYGLNSYSDSPEIFVVWQEGKWKIEKIFLYPKTYFEDGIIPSIEEVELCHDQASGGNLFSTHLSELIEIRLR